MNKINKVLNKIEKRGSKNVSPAGFVRGFHGGCPAVENERPKPLGTYALVPDGKGGVMCEACGTHDLIPRAEAEKELKDKGLL